MNPPTHSLQTSLVQPWLTSELKHFSVETLPVNYPHQTSRESGSGASDARHKILYFEFHGVGPPHDLDVGSPGDVYVDLTPGAFALWGYTKKGWKQWVDMGQDGKSTLSNEWAVLHPVFGDRVLWIGVQPAHCISWFDEGWRKVHASRRWALDRDLMGVTPREVGIKAKAVALKEAATMLAKLKPLREIPEFPESILRAREKRLNPPRQRSLSPLSDCSSIEGDVAVEHPCNMNPKPTSRVQPQIKVELKNFLAGNTLPTGYPYQLKPEVSNQRYRIPYFQFSDTRPPARNLDVGTAGDVYFDLTPGAYGLYGKTASGWQRWFDPGEGLGNQWPDASWLVRHPHITDRALWAVPSKTHAGTGHGSISWFRGPSSAREGRSTARQRGIVSRDLQTKKEKEKLGEASKVLEYVLSERVEAGSGASGSSPAKRSSSANETRPKKKLKRVQDKDEEPAFIHMTGRGN
ncbi:hypothetical protein FB45DRAFT_889288 [Roridomyces roridus]|uniref:Uncharacterized protein n=1 Tax=Roridomyces roridus TaxID=1738132 RepID=A0AAD7CKF7_9AGAR|nr:hypothetical protein FB45DRAFT_889288 [Roridomyces roridus]